MSTERLDLHGEFMHSVARKSGAMIRSGFDQTLDITIKDDNTPVTSIDTAIDRMVRYGVKETYPHHGYLGEEMGGDIDADRFWVCDPLDGTRPFINGIPLAAFSLSLIENDEVVCSVIHDPFTDRSLLSAKKEGAWMNGRHVHVSEHSSLNHADVHISWGKEGYINRIDHLRQLGAKVIKMDAAVYTGMLVSIGKLDADVFTGSKLWDVAAQSLAVSEAGGNATTLSGDDVRAAEFIDGLIISNGHIHDEILGIVQESRRSIE